MRSAAAALVTPVSTSLVIALVLGGCGSDAPKARTDVPEPAVSPVAATTPAGRLVPLPGAPEGLVVDATTRTVAVGVRKPDALALVDADTGVERSRTPLGGSPRHMALLRPGGPVLVPSEGNDRLYQVGLPGGQVVADAPTGRQPHDAAGAAGGRVFVGDELQDQVSVIEGDQAVERLPAPVQPGGLAGSPDGSIVVAVGVRGRQIEAYRADGTSLGRAQCGVGPTHVRAGADGLFYVADTQGDAVLVFRVADGKAPKQVGRVKTGGTPYGLAIDRAHQRLYVTLTATNQLRSFRIDALQPKPDRTWATPRQPDDVGVDETTGRVFVAGTADGVLQIIDPAAP